MHRVVIGLTALLFVEFYFHYRMKRAFTYVPRFKPPNWLVAGFLVYIHLYVLYLLAGVLFPSAESFFGSFAPENFWFDYGLMYPFWVYFLLMVQASLFFFLADASVVVLKQVTHIDWDVLRRYRGLVILAVTLFFAVYVPVRIVYDYNAVDVRTVTLVKQGLPAAMEGLTIAMVADLQADHYTTPQRLGKYLDKVNAAKPDIILIGGDFITTTNRYIAASASAVGKLRAPYGVWAVPGDHDQWAYKFNFKRSLHEVMEALKNNGINIYDNRKLRVPVAGGELGISFLTYTYSNKPDAGELDTLFTWQGNQPDIKVLLTHQPAEILRNRGSNAGYDLMLAGHTHGGQITFLFPFFSFSPSRFETATVRGDFRVGNMLLVVNRGLGMSLVPIRYNTTPEITLIRLTGRAGSG